MRSFGYKIAPNEWYQEPEWCVSALLAAEKFSGTIWDSACGEGNIPEACKKFGLDAFGTDIVNRGYGERVDFLSPSSRSGISATSIISNPPFSHMQEWADISLTIVSDRVALLGRLAFLEGQARAAWFDKSPLKTVYVLSKRISMPPGGSGVVAKGGSIAFAWFVFQRGFSGDAALKRLLPLTQRNIL